MPPHWVWDSKGEYKDEEILLLENEDGFMKLVDRFNGIRRRESNGL